jgi:hypothetical protein
MGSLMSWPESALPLFMPGVGTDHPDDAFAPNDFAIFAKFFY